MFSYPMNCGKLFQSFTIKHDVVCGIFVDVFYQTKKLPIFSVYVRTHTLWKSVGIYQMWLICYYVDDHVVFVLYSIIWYVILIEFCMLVTLYNLLYEFSP